MIIREALDPIGFERGKNPFDTMGVGMESWLSDVFDSFDVEEERGIKVVTVNGSVTRDHIKILQEKLQTSRSIPLIFNKVYGAFDCSRLELESLEGCPRYVEGNFYCDRNRLKTLEGGPDQVRGMFDCSDNYVTSLDGGPSLVKGHYYCQGNHLTKLSGLAPNIGGDFFYGVPANKWDEDTIRSLSNIRGKIKYSED